MKQPYAGEKDCTIIKSLKKHLKKTLPTIIEANITYTAIKLSSQLNHIEDPTPFGVSIISKYILTIIKKLVYKLISRIILKYDRLSISKLFEKPFLFRSSDFLKIFCIFCKCFGKPSLRKPLK